MATRRASWSRALVVHREDASAVRHENDENFNPMLSFEHESMVRERHVLVGCYARLHPRIPLSDISHLFPGSGNVSLASESLCAAASLLAPELLCTLRLVFACSHLSLC